MREDYEMVNGVSIRRRWWDDEARLVRTYSDEGNEVIALQKPYTAEENARADRSAQEKLTDEIAAQQRINTDALVAAQLQLTENAHEDGEPWVQPVGAHDAYKQDAEVTHNGKTWVSLTPFNVWAPGVSGWREKVTGGGYPAWVQPTGGHDAYGLGARVAHKGSNWESTVAANVWEPGVFGWNVI